MKEETEWRSKPQLKAKGSDSIEGLLCPHVNLLNQEGEQFSLRKLPEILQKKLVEENDPTPENFYIMLKFQENVGKTVSETAREIIAQQPMQGRIIDILVKQPSEVQDKTTSPKDTVLYCQEMSLLLEKLKANKEQIVILRSDATVISRI